MTLSYVNPGGLDQPMMCIIVIIMGCDLTANNELRAIPSQRGHVTPRQAHKQRVIECAGRRTRRSVWRDDARDGQSMEYSMRPDVYVRPGYGYVRCVPRWLSLKRCAPTCVPSHWKMAYNCSSWLCKSYVMPGTTGEKGRTKITAKRVRWIYI